jgi:aspartate aminotransferase-like enzyme
LCRLTRARNVEIFTGSATLANDVIAGQLSLLDQPGLILSNGEFGERLIDQGRRWRLDFEPISVPWGESFDEAAIVAAMDRRPDLGWVWMAHTETSTGVLNHSPRLLQACAHRELKFCLDCVSSLGVIEVDLGSVWMASGSSGKGLGAPAGLALVFYQHPVEPQPDRLPACLDLGYYAAQDGVPFTISTPLVRALLTSVEHPDGERQRSRYRQQAAFLRAELEAMGWRILADAPVATPAVLTLVLPPDLPSRRLCEAAERTGVLLTWQSRYLLKRNWMQISLMSRPEQRELERLLAFLRTWTPEPVKLETVPVGGDQSLLSENGAL